MHALFEMQNSSSVENDRQGTQRGKKSNKQKKRWRGADNAQQFIGKDTFGDHFKVPIFKKNYN